MEQHLGAGRLHAAIRQFQRVRTILDRELGVPPSNATVAVYRRALGTAASGSLRPGLVGREVELVRARAGLRRAASGRPAAVLVSGPAGIGKTRLCEEMADQAAADGWLVLRAAAREPTASVPYSSLAEAVNGALVQRPELAECLGEADRRILALLDGSATGPPPGPVHRQSALHLVMRVVAAAGAPNGLLFLDDLQHVDDATVELVDILARAPYPRGLPVVATYREQPPAATAALRDSLVAAGIAVEIELGPLRRAEIEEIVAGVRGERPPPADLDLVWELSGGNAFFATEMASGVGAASGLAAGVESAISARMAGLADGARAALRAVAVVADGFTADEFAALTAVDADRALEWLEAATGAGIVTRLGPRYRFRHDLVRDALRRSVAEADVVAAHGGAADRLAVLGAPPARVAHHLLAVRRPAEALPWLRRAVDEAQAVGAPAEAVALADRALALAPGDAGLLAQRAGALDVMGHPGAPAAYAVAMAVAGPALRGTLAVRRAKALVVAGDIPAALETLAGVDDLPPAGRAQLHVARGLALWCAGQLDGAGEAGRQAKALAVASGDLRDFVDATRLLAMVAHQQGAWPQRASLDLLDATLRPDLAAVVIYAHLCVAESYLYGGAPYPEVVAFASDLRRRAVDAGAPRAEAFATTLLGEAHLLMGATGPAMGYLRAAVAMHRDVGVLCGEALTLQRLAEALVLESDAGGAR
ncbi:MAG TPA: AAA family ATPase, partial [Acidimicrobiales bacterium]|nr:AAA family ATPase [Acidimicrobiales bacterium]